MHRIKVAMSGTSKARAKKAPSKVWMEADALFSSLELPSLLVESALDESVQAWEKLSLASKKFGASMRGVLELSMGVPPGVEAPSYPSLMGELEEQLGLVGSKRGLERVQEAKRLLTQYCGKIRELQGIKFEHEKANTEAEYYRAKVESMRESLGKRKKGTESESEKLKRNEEKLRSFESQVEKLEGEFLMGARFLVEWQGAVWDRVVVGYIIGQSAMMESNPFRGLATSVKADFGVLLGAPLDAIDMENDCNYNRVPIDLDNDSEDKEGSYEVRAPSDNGRFVREPTVPSFSGALLAIADELSQSSSLRDVYDGDQSAVEPGETNFNQNVERAETESELSIGKDETTTGHEEGRQEVEGMQPTTETPS